MVTERTRWSEADNTPATNGVARSGGGESRSLCAAAVSKVTSNGLITSMRGRELGVHAVGAE